MTFDEPGDDVFTKRRVGVLLHPTCLPNEWGILGQSARSFADFLAEAGISVWQTLPIGPTHADLSPYQSLSAHAGNPDFIDLAELIPPGFLQAGDLERADLNGGRKYLLELAAQRFFDRSVNNPEGLDHDSYDRFQESNAYWLNDFSLFSAVRESQPGMSWLQWPTALRDGHPEALKAFEEQSGRVIKRIRFEQFVFHHQWQTLREYAYARGILLFGDIPIFVAHDSADVWANRELFKLDAEGNPTVVAGVPPDYFSSEGQHWGNPLYDWDAMAGDGYHWWMERLESQRRLFTLIRIDHFRGLQAYWEIPADRPRPKDGYWVPGPGAHFLEACFRQFPDLPLVAENLGIIGDDVEQLRRDFQLPGMTVLQFGFDGSPENPHLLHNHQERDLVYTGTHDNDTTLGWYHSLDNRTREYVNSYLGTSGEDMPWPVIEAAFRSVSSLAVVPMQDFMGLDTAARFNTPGTTESNWIWKLNWEVCPTNLCARIRNLAELYGRLT